MVNTYTISQHLNLPVLKYHAISLAISILVTKLNCVCLSKDTCNENKSSPYEFHVDNLAIWKQNEKRFKAEKKGTKFMR